MKTIYQVRWKVADEVCEADYLNLESAKKRAETLSIGFRMAMIGEFKVSEHRPRELVHKWTYKDGFPHGNERVAA